MKLFIATALLVSLSGVARADGADHPCKKIHEACEAAGFKKGDHKDKKGLFKDCVQPIMAGQTVAGVTVDKADIDACKTKKAEKGDKKGAGSAAPAPAGSGGW